MVALTKLATMALAMQGSATSVNGHGNFKALPDPHHTGTDPSSYDNVIHANPYLESVPSAPRRRLRQSSFSTDKATAPAPTFIDKNTSPMQAPAPQTMTRVPGLVTKDKQFSVTDGGCTKWTLPPGEYVEGHAYSCCCKCCCNGTTYAPYKEQIVVETRDCCGHGAEKETLVLSPSTDHGELPATFKCC